ncbi:conserved hypothetical protein [Candidatus Brocadia pituitae]|nr:conserved hypothetical protein [Candidatus Brocadia pituitae]
MSERIVNHFKYGHGVVKQSRYKDFELLVQFQDGLTRWIRFDELEQTSPKPQIASLATSLPTPPISEAFKSRRMIEAFRLGIVPYDCVEDFTFGRQDETKELMDWLNSEENVLLLIGEYGTGKTHLQHHIYWRALQERFAVANVSMDPNEVPFHKPKRVYSHLIQTFRYYSNESKQNKEFRAFLKEVFIRGFFKDHLYFKYLIDKDTDETLWNWIEALESIIRPYTLNNLDYINLPGLYDYSNTVNIYCYLISALGWAAKEVLGLKGLLLIFDEAETIDILFSSPQSARARNFLKALILTTQNDEILFDNSRIVYCQRGIDCCLRGEGSKIPFIYKYPSGLKLLCAFTPINTLDQIDELRSNRRIYLESLNDTAFRKAFENICLLYENAYGNLKGILTIEKHFQDVMKHSKYTRSFVKSAVEVLDLIRLNQRDG